MTSRRLRHSGRLSPHETDCAHPENGANFKKIKHFHVFSSLLRRQRRQRAPTTNTLVLYRAISSTSSDESRRRAASCGVTTNAKRSARGRFARNNVVSRANKGVATPREFHSINAWHHLASPIRASSSQLNHVAPSSPSHSSASHVTHSTLRL